MTGHTIKETGPEEYALPAFWTDLREEDLPILREQTKGRKFDTSAVLAVARRCRHGFPQVVVSSPISSSGMPFPTVFWLTCPFLDHRCGELESEQRIAELEELFGTRSEAVAKMHLDYAKLRLSLAGGEAAPAFSGMSAGMRRSLAQLGVGGINWRDAPRAVKCLHLQTATWLGMGGHPAGEWLAEKIGAQDCAAGRCAKALTLLKAGREA